MFLWLHQILMARERAEAVKLFLKIHLQKQFILFD